ncbi:MAG: 16S rRNA (cytidine(1402)-2'-O)-methyltransferase [Armatimonadota bacterium]|nr:16S rRNA (cytidine(1402)-2'-O)-methyltransferase [Armatimonadota bacterium]
MYLVATPIGNLEDITLRALRILREASLIAAEDTRRTRQLLNHFDIHTSTASYHDHSPPARLEMLLDRLRSGDDLALVTDAGTPGISDPGHALVRAAIDAGIPVISIPGASAVLTALVPSGLPCHSFIFEGFLPRQRAAREAVLNRLRGETRTTVFFEAPHRVHKTLDELTRVLGDRPVAIARELTKVFEEIWRGSLLASVERWKGPQRGEFVIVIGGDEATGDSCVGTRNDGEGLSEPSGSPEDLTLFLNGLVEGGMTRRDAARHAAAAIGVPFRHAYRATMRKGDRE